MAAAELEEFYGDTLRELDHIAYHWPLHVAVSHTRNQRAIGGPAAGTRQLHMVCWRKSPVGKVCGTTVSILAMGPTFYLSSCADIIAGIRLHIAQCHPEEMTCQT